VVVDGLDRPDADGFVSLRHDLLTRR